MPGPRVASLRTATRDKFGGYLLEQLQPFSGETVFELRKASDVTAGLRHAFDQA